MVIFDHNCDIKLVVFPIMKKFQKLLISILAILIAMFVIWVSKNWVEAGRQIRVSDSALKLDALEPSGKFSQNQKLIFLIHNWEPSSNWPCSVLFGKWHASNYLVRGITTSRNHIERAFISCRLERDYTNFQLGNYFLAKAYVGRGERGVEKVSQQLFEKSFNDLTRENVVQIGLIIKTPNLRDNSQRLRAQTNYWLEKLKSE